VGGIVLDVSELQDSEHKGGGVYNYGADMTSMFGSVHGNAANRDSLHVEGSTVIQNLQEKVQKYTFGYITPFEGIRLDDPGHPWWIPHKKVIFPDM
jgi:hypothetical protein